MDWILFAIFFGGCAAAGSTGALFMPDDWYRKELVKPRWTPPDWLFPLAWSTLYILIALAATRAAMYDDNEYALGLWALQMTLNGLWSPVFFGLKRIRDAMIVVAALWLAVAATMIALFMLETLAGLLFVPYLLWVTVAASLNFSIWRTNPDPSRAAA